jgi:fructokinase
VRPVLTVIGEALVDLVPGAAGGGYRAAPGGSPFNVAIGLARLGNRTALMARFAEDEHGRLLRATAGAEGIDLSAAPRASEPASVAIASVDAQGDVSYDFEIDGTADWQWTTAELGKLNRDTAVLHFGSIASWTAPGAARIAELVRAIRTRGGALISYDPNVRPAVIGSRERAVGWVEESVRAAHVVKASGEDIEWLYPQLAVDAVAATWSQLGPDLVVITHGAGGASAYRQGRAALRQPGREVAVVDTIGAGDAFTAGLLTGVMRRRRHRPGRLESTSEGALADIVDEAVLISAMTCERAGADPPRLDEVLERQRKPQPAGERGLA